LAKEGGGRVAAFEIMIGTQAVRNLIREGKIAQMYSSIQTGSAVGMQTLDQSLNYLVGQGVIRKDVANEKAKFPDTF
jgi:twitching motility protein PilT